MFRQHRRIQYVWGERRTVLPGRLGQEVLIILSLEVIGSRGATAQALAILQLLDVAQTSGDATVAIAVVAVEGHADLAVAAGVNLGLVEDRLNFAVHDLRSLAAVGIEEVTASICLFPPLPALLV